MENSYQSLEKGIYLATDTYSEFVDVYGQIGYARGFMVFIVLSAICAELLGSFGWAHNAIQFQSFSENSELTESFPRIYKVHGIQYSWLKDVEWHFNKFREALTMYYEFERKKFLPLAERLYKSKRTNINHGTIRKLQKSFSIIEKDQDRLQRLMQTVRNKGNQFENPEGA